MAAKWEARASNSIEGADAYVWEGSEDVCCVYGDDVLTAVHTAETIASDHNKVQALEAENLQLRGVLEAAKAFIRESIIGPNTNHPKWTDIAVPQKYIGALAEAVGHTYPDDASKTAPDASPPYIVTKISGTVRDVTVDEGSTGYMKPS